MAKTVQAISDLNRTFIERQKVFFVATAPATGRINLSPKGMDTFRVLSPTRAAWLNLTGSGNETAAHLLENGRITLMFCAFEGKPNILRLYGKGRSVHPRDKDWNDLIALFPKIPGGRQIIVVDVESVQNSCGFGVPLMEFKGPREDLERWALNKGEEGIKAYQREKNSISLDGKETGL
ncbi:MAG: pyridoxamine 5'-phosphate oxidase family protein [Bacteroidota bacterium]